MSLPESDGASREEAGGAPPGAGAGVAPAVVSCAGGIVLAQALYPLIGRVGDARPIAGLGGDELEDIYRKAVGSIADLDAMRTRNEVRHATK